MWNYSHRRAHTSAILAQGAGKCDFPDESIASPVLDTFTVFSSPSPFSDSPAAQQDFSLVHPVPPLLLSWENLCISFRLKSKSPRTDFLVHFATN